MNSQQTLHVHISIIFLLYILVVPLHLMLFKKQRLFDAKLTIFQR